MQKLVLTCLERCVRLYRSKTDPIIESSNMGLLLYILQISFRACAQQILMFLSVRALIAWRLQRPMLDASLSRKSTMTHAAWQHHWDNDMHDSMKVCLALSYAEEGGYDLSLPDRQCWFSSADPAQPPTSTSVAHALHHISYFVAHPDKEQPRCPQQARGLSYTHR